MESAPSSSTSASAVFQPFTGEKVRGMVLSVICGIFANVLNVFGQGVLHLHPLVSTALFLNLAGNLSVYAVDIVFAKESFGGNRVPYSDLHTRLSWLGQSFLKPTFMKFIITAIIDSIIMLEMLDYAIYMCEKYDVRFRFRNEIIASLLSILTFILWVNAMRFNWAYSESEDAIMNILVMAWLGIVIMIFCATRTMRSWKADSDAG